MPTLVDKTHRNPSFPTARMESSTTFWEPLMGLHKGQLTREKAVAEIAGQYRHLVQIFEEKACAAA